MICLDLVLPFNILFSLNFFLCSLKRERKKSTKSSRFCVYVLYCFSLSCFLPFPFIFSPLKLSHSKRQFDLHSLWFRISIRYPNNLYLISKVVGWQQNISAEGGREGDIHRIYRIYLFIMICFNALEICEWVKRYNVKNVNVCVCGGVAVCEREKKRFILPLGHQ